MSIAGVGGPGLADAVVAATATTGCVLVAAPGDPLAAEVGRRAPGRVVPVAGTAIRAAVAAGVALAGRRALVLGDGDVPVRLPLSDLPAGSGIVVLARDARVAGACWGSGWTLVQPAWPADLQPLLEAAVAGATPVVVRLPADDGHATGAPPAPPRLGVPRVLRDGTGGLLAASGPRAVRLLAVVAQMLAGRGVALQALDLHTAAPGEGPGPLTADGMLFTGDGPVDAGELGHGRWPPLLRRVPVPGDPRGAMEAVAAHLRARR